MTTGIALVVIIGTILAAAYGGYAGGLYESLYGLLRELSAFIVAITFGLPLSDLLADTAGTAYLSRGYYEFIAFAALVIGIFALGRWLRTRFTIPVVRTLPGLNEGGGALLGALHGMVITGIILVAWSLMPVVKYIPRDHGRIDPPAALDTGSIMLKVYGGAAEAMGGNDYVVYGEPLTEDANGNGEVDQGEFEDLNGNGEWDPGLLWQYKHHADIYPETLSGGLVHRPPSRHPPRFVSASAPYSSPARS